MDGVALTSVRPVGSASATATFVAASAPLFLTDSEKVTLVPRVGVALLTVFVITRSASGMLNAAVAELFPVLESCVVDAMDAAFVSVAREVGVATIVTEAVPPFGMSASVQVTVPDAFVQPEEADTKVNPAGRVSVIVGARAAVGPAFVAVTVNVTFAPSAYGPADTDFASDRFADRILTGAVSLMTSSVVIDPLL